MKKNVLGLIMAFDPSDEMKELTDTRTVAAVPFGGRYRIIDFMMSNMVNSNINNVGVVLCDRYQSLIDHIGTGKDWDLARKIGGIRLLPPYSYSTKKTLLFDLAERRYKIEGLIGIMDFIQKTKAEYIILSDGNIVTNIDLEEVVDTHIESEADITCVCVPKNEESKHDTYYEVDRQKNIKDICVSVDINGKCKYTGLGVYVLKKQLLEKLVTAWASKNYKQFELEGLGMALKEYNLKAYVHNTFAAKITDIGRYYDANMALLSRDVRAEVFAKNSPILTKVHDEQPTYYSDKSKVCESLIADGCTLEGNVENSVIFRDVHVKGGATVKNAIILAGASISKDANLLNIVTDKKVSVSEGKVMMGHEKYPIVVAKNSSL